MREPPFWWRSAGIEAKLLAPVAALYGAVAARRLGQRGRRIDVPVVCVGNLTVGGAGKTPTALALARMLAQAGESPVLLSRGYGGRLAGPVQVDPQSHRAADIGDEPLLLACAAPTIVARDRVAGAQMALAVGASVVVMDDGFQNPFLNKDISVLVVDAGRGIGNGRVIPAGPLRAPLAPQFDRVDAFILVGTSGGPPEVLDHAARRRIPVFRAALVPDADALAALRDARVLAFAGIGDPHKFFATLRAAGIEVAVARGFADHHRYTSAEAHELLEEARRGGLTLLTTEKDLARLHGADGVGELAAAARPLPVRLTMTDEGGLQMLLLQRMAAARVREPA